jgi:hypothetical protein
VTAVGLRLVAVGMMVLLASRSAAARNVTAVGPHPAAVGVMVQHAFINAAAMRWPTAQKSQYERIQMQSFRCFPLDRNGFKLHHFRDLLIHLIDGPRLIYSLI